MEFIKKSWDIIAMIITRIAEAVLFISILLFAAAINYAVFARMFGNSASWVEALTINLQVWVAMLGISLGLREGGLPAIELLLLKIAQPLKKPLMIIINLIVIYTAVMLIIYGWKFTTLMGRSVIASIEFMTYKWLYAAIPVGGILMVLFSIEKLVSIIWGKEVQLVMDRLKAGDMGEVTRADEGVN